MIWQKLFVWGVIAADIMHNQCCMTSPHGSEVIGYSKKERVGGGLWMTLAHREKELQKPKIGCTRILMTLAVCTCVHLYYPLGLARDCFWFGPVCFSNLSYYFRKLLFYKNPALITWSFLWIHCFSVRLSMYVYHDYMIHQSIDFLLTIMLLSP